MFEDVGTKTVWQMAVPQECLTFNSVTYLIETTTDLSLSYYYYYILFCSVLLEQQKTAIRKFQ
jgi:hypothetical protein